MTATQKIATNVLAADLLRPDLPCPVHGAPARGQHHVLKMSTIVRRLRDEFDLSAAEIGVRLGMEPEEVSRLYDAGDVVQHLGRADGSFNKGWVPG